MNEVIQVHVLGSEEQIRSLEEKFLPDELSEVHIHRISDIHDKLGLENVSEKFADKLFAWLCVSEWKPNGHYGTPKEYSPYYYTIGSNTLYILSVIIALIAMLIVESNISSTIEHSKSVELLSVQAEEYKKIYKTKFETYEPVFTHARSMNAVVDLADHIYKSSRVSPLDFMLEISETLTQSGAGKVHIDKIEWDIEQIMPASSKNERTKSSVDITTDYPVQHTGILKGRIEVSDNNYRGSVSQVNKIVDVLMKNERIVAVEALEMPVDVRSERNFADESGIEARAGVSKQRGVFSLKITMKAPNHA